MISPNFKENAASILTAPGFLTIVGLNPSDDSPTWEQDLVLAKLLGVALILLGIAIYRFKATRNHAS